MHLFLLFENRRESCSTLGFSLKNVYGWFTAVQCCSGTFALVTTKCLVFMSGVIEQFSSFRGKERNIKLSDGRCTFTWKHLPQEKETIDS